MGGGQEGNYVQTLPGVAHWARRGEEVAGVDERPHTRRGTGPAPFFPLFGHTRLAFPHYLFGRLLYSWGPCSPVYLPSFESPEIRESGGAV